jgi:nitroimidazol reductase NimA-like FMN-containing flavoprotein (pyridoxamine 5'-phosphate oxidase superfamily)
MASESEITELDEQQCWALLASHQIGRLGVNADLFPLIFVVNYGLDAATVIIRTHAGTKLNNCHQTRVGFEVDDIDYLTRSGWSVLVRAIADTVTGAERDRLIERTSAHPVQPWAPGEHGHWLRLTPLMITGRRLIPGQLPPPFPDAAYP